MDGVKERAPMNLDSADEQALRLLKAFYHVDDREAREVIITLAESAVRGISIGAAAADTIADSGPA
jgi:hypothetical protein